MNTKAWLAAVVGVVAGCGAGTLAFLGLYEPAGPPAPLPTYQSPERDEVQRWKPCPSPSVARGNDCVTFVELD